MTVESVTDNERDPGPEQEEREDDAFSARVSGTAEAPPERASCARKTVVCPTFDVCLNKRSYPVE